MIEQCRILATQIPGPKSQALQERKVAAVSAALESDARISEIPIRAVAPDNGELVWLLDRKAARALGTPPM